MLQFFAQASGLTKKKRGWSGREGKHLGKRAKTVDAFSKNHQLRVKSFVQSLLIPFDATDLYAVTSASGVCGTMWQTTSILTAT